MKDGDKKKLSKFMSLVLRHKLGSLKLDSRGCCKIDDLINVVNRRTRLNVTRADVIKLTIPSEDPNIKTRFELEGNFIRAGHGHSIKIEGYEKLIPSQPLYHATTESVIDSIMRSGLCAMNRQKVHLSYDKAITIEAAKRRSRNIVLIRIKSEEAVSGGVSFYKSADERIVLSDDIPPEYLEVEAL